jgi:hypothetical protein
MRLNSALVVLALASTMPVFAQSAPFRTKAPRVVLLAEGLQGGSGSTIGPDGALYVTEGAVGRVSRVNPRTGMLTPFATGLPKAVFPIGGAMDIAFVGRTAYVLVTLVAADVGGADTVGLYRIDGADRFTVIADVGAFNLRHPPTTPFFVPTGVQYALEPYRDGFLVTDGHHNRVLYVTRGGHVAEFMVFGNIVPTGLAQLGNIILMAQAGPVPHLAEHGRIVAFGPHADGAIRMAAGARLLVDVEVALDRRLYALSQGDFIEGNPDGSPAVPNTGSLVRAESDGTFTVIADRLNQPTSLELVGDTAYVVTLGGEIWTIEGISRVQQR